MVMLMTATGLFRNGIQDWLYQRVSAVLILLYVLIGIGIAIKHPQLDYATWHAIFSHIAVKIMTLLVLLSIVVHAWIGIWTVTTDYLKCACVRLCVQVAVIVWLLALFMGGALIVGSV